MPRTKRDAQEDEKREIAEKLRRLREEFYARQDATQCSRRGVEPPGSVIHEEASSP